MKRSSPLPLVVAVLALGGAVAFFLLREGETSPLERIAKTSAQVAVIPSADQIARDLDRLANHELTAKVLDLFGQSDPDKMFAHVAQIVGADIRDPKALAAIGIASDKPIFAFGPKLGEAPALALPVADRDAIESWIDRVALARLGAKPAREEDLNGHSARVHATKPEGAPALASVQSGGYLYVGNGPGGLDILKAAFAIEHGDSLASDASFAAFGQSLDRPSIYGRGLLSDMGWAIGAAVTLDPDRLALRLSLPNAPRPPSATAKSDRASLNLPLTGRAAPRDQIARLNPSAHFFAQTGIDPTALVALRPQNSLLTRFAEQILRLLNLDLDTLAAELEPGVALSVRLAPEANLMAITRGLGGMRGVNPFDIAHVELVAQVKSAERARAILDRVASLAPVIGASAQRFTREGEPIDDGQIATGAPTAFSAIQALASAAGLSLKAGTPNPAQIAHRWTYRYRLGEGLTFELDDRRLFVSGGRDVAEALATRSPAQEAPHRLDASDLVLHTDLGALIASLRALPESSFGIGGFAIKSSLDRWLGAFDALDALRLTVRQEGEKLHLDASLSFQKRPKQSLDAGETVSP